MATQSNFHKSLQEVTKTGGCCLFLRYAEGALQKVSLFGKSSMDPFSMSSVTLEKKVINL